MTPPLALLWTAVQESWNLAPGQTAHGDADAQRDALVRAVDGTAFGGLAPWWDLSVPAPGPGGPVAAASRAARRLEVAVRATGYPYRLRLHHAGEIPRMHADPDGECTGLVLLPEYGADPLWGHPIAFNQALEEWVTDRILRRDLRRWAAWFDGTDPFAEPVPHFRGGEPELRRFDRAGRLLWVRLRAAVGLPVGYQESHSGVVLWDPSLLPLIDHLDEWEVIAADAPPA